MRRNLETVPKFAGEGPFTEGQLRWFIFNAASNGLSDAGAIVKVGRRVYIDSDRFDDWIERRNLRSAGVAA